MRVAGFDGHGLLKILDALADGGISTLVPQITALQVGLAGFGLGLMPESTVQEELRLGTLRALKVSAMRLRVPVVLVHRRRGFLSGAARSVIELLRAGRAGG